MPVVEINKKNIFFQISFKQILVYDEKCFVGKLVNKNEMKCLTKTHLKSIASHDARVGEPPLSLPLLILAFLSLILAFPLCGHLKAHRVLWLF